MLVNVIVKMAIKKLIKDSEKRILIYLHQVDMQKCYIMAISTKLDMDYGYLSKILNKMFNKGWIKKQQGFSTNKVYYKLTAKGHLKRLVTK